MHPTLHASQLYALSLGYEHKGGERCHWCGAPTERTWLHNDPPPTLFSRPRTFTAIPASPYECIGCWLWHRQRVTVHYLNGSLRDRQCAERHSWWITREGSYVIGMDDHTALYDHLLNPPRQFCLSLLDSLVAINLLQLVVCNDHMEVKADTPLAFTINQVKYQYTIYELEHALKHGSEGTSPGVQALIRHLGSFSLPDVKRGVGRPRKGDEQQDAKILKKIVRASGT